MMTYPTTLSPFPEITPDLLLRGGKGEVNCHWCKKIMAACDGKTSLAEIARRTHLPLKTCIKLVERALPQGWFEVVATGEPPAPGFWNDLNGRLTATLGPTHSEALLAQTLKMIRREADSLRPGDHGKLLLALELAATVEQRERLEPHLEALRQAANLP